jgi:hypothetical protein
MARRAVKSATSGVHPTMAALHGTESAAGEEGARPIEDAAADAGKDEANCHTPADATFVMKNCAPIPHARTGKECLSVNRAPSAPSIRR